MKKLTFDDVYGLCNTYGYFTDGSVKAYNKMFDLVRAEAPTKIIAAVIWVCSPDSLLEEITSQLQEIRGEVPNGR